MTYPILEPVERHLAKDLLRLSEIYDEYNVKSAIWVAFFQKMAEATNTLKDANGDPVRYTPAQLIRDSLFLLISVSEDLLTSIRHLREADSFKLSDLYTRLEHLEIKKVSETDHKGLYVLAAKAAEDGGVFHE